MNVGSNAGHVFVGFCRLLKKASIVDRRNFPESIMQTLTNELPVEGLPLAAKLTDNFADEARFLLALKFFELGRISSGKAGWLCGMGRV